MARAVARGPTSRDVAQALGIAQSTVSRAFTPGASISDALRGRIHATAEAIGYRPNLLARGLIAGRSRLIGVLIAPQTNLLYPELLYELARGLAAEEHQLLLCPAEDAAAAARAVERLQAFRVDAVLATGVLGEAAARALVAAGVPLVTFNRLFDGIAGVSCDFAGAGSALAGDLLAAGRRRLALLSGPPDSWVGAEVERGVRAATGGRTASALAVVHAPYAYEAGAAALAEAERLLGGRADAILCVNDIVAAGCLDHLRRERPDAVPADISLVTIVRSAPTPAGNGLSGMRQPMAPMIAAAIDMLLGRWTGRERLIVPALPAAGATAVAGDRP